MLIAIKKCSNKKCRCLHYPNFYIQNGENSREYIFYDEWFTDDFVISPHTSYRMTLLANVKAHTQKTRCSFKGEAGAYNFCHGYDDEDYTFDQSKEYVYEVDDENKTGIKIDDDCNINDIDVDLFEEVITNKSLADNVNLYNIRFSLKRKLLEITHFRYSILKMCNRHHVPLSTIVQYVSIDKTLAVNMYKFKEMFNIYSDNHKCGVAGCKDVIVLDGNQKNTRKKCSFENVYVQFDNLPSEFSVKVGCPETPMQCSKYCTGHDMFAAKSSSIKKSDVIIDDDAPIESSSDSIYLVESIIGEKIVRGKKYYHVKWLDYDDTTYEPKENIPRSIIERYKKFGSLSVDTYMMKRTEYRGMSFVNLYWKCTNGESLNTWLPESAMSINCSAYDIHISERDIGKLHASCINVDDATKCNTRKDKFRFYKRSAGIILAAYPCQHIRMLEEVFNSESITQVYAYLHNHLVKCFANRIYNRDSLAIVYDDACHLKKFAMKRNAMSEVSMYLSKADIFCDRLHFQNHIDSWCRKNCNPDDCNKLKHVNTEACEQIFSWMSKYAYMSRYMNRHRFFFFLLDLCDIHNYMIEKRSVTK